MDFLENLTNHFSNNEVLRNNKCGEILFTLEYDFNSETLLLKVIKVTKHCHLGFVNYNYNRISPMINGC